MNKDIENFVRSTIQGTSPNYAIGLISISEEYPDLTLNEVLEKAKQLSADEQHKSYDIAANFLRNHAKKLGIKLD